MSFDYQTGGDTSTGGKFLTEPGTYHCLVTAVTENPTNPKGELIDNAAFRVDLAILEGTSPNQKDKVKDFVLFNPKPSDKNEGAFAKKRFDFFFLAAGLLTKQQIENKEKVSIDLQSAVGKQIVCKFQMDDNDKYLELAFADIFHVDDPAVKEVPKDKDSLAMLPPSQRWIGDKPADKKPADKKPAEKKPELAAAASAANYSDL